MTSSPLPPNAATAVIGCQCGRGVGVGVVCWPFLAGFGIELWLLSRWFLQSFAACVRVHRHARGQVSVLHFVPYSAQQLRDIVMSRLPPSTTPIFEDAVRAHTCACLRASHVRTLMCRCLS